MVVYIVWSHRTPHLTNNKCPFTQFNHSFPFYSLPYMHTITTLSIEIYSPSVQVLVQRSIDNILLYLYKKITNNLNSERFLHTLRSVVSYHIGACLAVPLARTVCIFVFVFDHCLRSFVRSLIRSWEVKRKSKLAKPLW